MYLTWLDSNSWLIELAGVRVLVDPWLVGPLVFGNLTWLFKGERPQPRSIPDNIDLIVLSQGLPDHAHLPTLSVLSREIPVVASPNAAEVVTGLGYTQVTALDHGETFRLGNSLEVHAVPGSPVGPSLIENGYIIKQLSDGLTIYYEPHGYHSPTLKDQAPIDVAIAPVLDLILPLVGPVIRGTQKALELATWVHPQVMLPTADAGDVHYEGLLAYLLRVGGSVDEVQAALAQQGLATQVLKPRPGERFELALQPQATTA